MIKYRQIILIGAESMSQVQGRIFECSGILHTSEGYVLHAPEGYTYSNGSIRQGTHVQQPKQLWLRNSKGHPVLSNNVDGHDKRLRIMPREYPLAKQFGMTFEVDGPGGVSNPTGRLTAMPHEHLSKDYVELLRGHAKGQRAILSADKQHPGDNR